LPAIFMATIEPALAPNLLIHRNFAVVEK